VVKYRARLILQAANIAGGVMAVHMAYIAAYYIRFHGTPPLENFGPYIKVGPFITGAILIFLGIYGMHNNVRKTLPEIFSSVFVIMFLISVTSVAISYFFGRFAFPRSVFLISAALQLVFLNTWFCVMRFFERTAHGKRQVIIIGEYSRCRALHEKLENDSEGLFVVDGIITEAQSVMCAMETGVSIVGNYENYKNKMAFAENNNKIFIMCSELNPDVKMDIIYFCLKNNISLYVIPQIYEILLAQSRIVQIDDIMLFGLGGLQLDPNYRLVKRLMDVVISSAALLLLAVPICITAVIIKIDSKGPVFYRQKRVGENGRIFRIYKFRTMIQNAEQGTGPVLAESDDFRVTTVGKFLRSTRMDELPQLINVLKGEMSLVGPRPERPFFVNQFSQTIPDYIYRTHIKAGVTGLAQVEGKYSTSPQDKLRYDLLYAKTYSPLNDVKILFKTLKILFIRSRSL